MVIGALVQARMSSTRFPGKSLHPVKDKPMLAYLLERLDRCQGLYKIVVVTSLEESDQPIADFCRKQGVDCYRGPLNNVAKRFKDALEVYKLDVFVRVNGDSPLLDPHLVEKCMAVFLEQDADLATNVLTRTFPKGQSVEAVRASTYMEAFGKMIEEEELEHVTRHFYIHPGGYRIFNIQSGRNLGAIQLSVDTPEDMALFGQILSRMTRPHWEYGLEEVLSLREQVLAEAGSGTV